MKANKLINKRLLIILSLSILFVLTNSYTVFSYDDNVKFRRITVENGLSQMNVNKIFQDSEGYMWFGTGDGLNKYNGREFTVYRYRQNNYNTLSNNVIRDIDEDKDKNIWIGTSNGLNRINYDDGKTNMYIPNTNGCSISSGSINDIFLDSKGNILIGTNDGLNIYNEKEDNFTRLYTSDNPKFELDNEMIFAIEEDSKGNYWIGTYSGLNKVDNVTKEITKFNFEGLSEYKPENITINTLYLDGNTLWIGVRYGGLYKINIETEKLEKVKISNEKINDHIDIRDIEKSDDNTFWFATDIGLGRYNIESQNLYLYKNKPYDNNTISNSNIRTVNMGQAGYLWVGTEDGINIFNANSAFSQFKNDIFDENSLSDSSISGIYEDDKGLLWVGTNRYGLNIIDRNNDKVTRINMDSFPLMLSNNDVREVVGIGNEVWVATQNGLNKIDSETNTSTVYGVNEGLIDTDIRSLLIDNEGNLWIGSRTRLFLFDRKKSITDLTDLFKENGINVDRIRDIYQDDEGVFWIVTGGESGLVKYNKKLNTFKVYNDFNDGIENKGTDTLWGVTSDSSNIWLSTNGGIIKIDKKTDEYKRYTEQEGLSNNNVLGILLDKNNDLWISTYYGISYFKVKSETFITYDITDGLQGNEFNQYSYFKSKNGEMLFGGMYGLTVFNPKDIIDNENVFEPKLKLETLLVNGKNLIFEDNFTSKHDENNISFKLFFPDYKDSKNIKFAYNLSGVDNQWVYSEGRSYIAYTNLEPGDYTFKALARGSDGIWSKPLTIQFKIAKPLWKTPFAYFIYLSICIIIIWFIYNRVNLLNKLIDKRTKQLNNKLEENERLYSKLLKNEKYKNNYFINLSHELRTPLNIINSVQALVKDLNKTQKELDRRKLDYYMDSVKLSSDRLLNLINNIINTSKIESGQYKLDMKIYNIVEIVENVALSMRELVNEKGIELIIDPEIEEKFIRCDKDEIEKVIINLIANAIKFTEESGKIEVIINDLGNEIQIGVKDTGKGIDPKYHKRIFNRFDQAYESSTEEHGGSGLGLTLTKQLIELHNGRIYVESELGKGSKFIIILPV